MFGVDQGTKDKVAQAIYTNTHVSPETAKPRVLMNNLICQNTSNAARGNLALACNKYYEDNKNAAAIFGVVVGAVVTTGMGLLATTIMSSPAFPLLAVAGVIAIPLTGIGSFFAYKAIDKQCKLNALTQAAYEAKQPISK